MIAIRDSRHMLLRGLGLAALLAGAIALAPTAARADSDYTRGSIRVTGRGGHYSVSEISFGYGSRSHHGYRDRRSVYPRRHHFRRHGYGRWGFWRRHWFRRHGYGPRWFGHPDGFRRHHYGRRGFRRFRNLEHEEHERDEHARRRHGRRDHDRDRHSRGPYSRR